MLTNKRLMLAVQSLFVCALAHGNTAFAEKSDADGGRQDGVDPHDLSSTIGHEAAEADDVDESLIGYTPDEGFRLRSADGDYRLRVGIQAGFKVEPVWTDGDGSMDSSLAFVRTIFSGNVYRPWLGYRVSLELSDDPFVLDAHFDIHPWEEFAFRFGQQWTPLSRHDNLGVPQVFFPEHSGVAGYFWSGRDRGLTVYGTLFDERLDYFVGAFAGTPIDVPLNLNENYVVEARFTANPMGPANANEFPFTPDGEALPTRVSFTAQGYYGRLQTGEESYNLSNGVLQPMAVVDTDEIAVAAADVWFQTGPLIVFGEFYWRRLTPLQAMPTFTSYGAWGQAILDVYKNLIGVGGRFNWLEPNTDLASDESYEVEAQVAYFIKPPQVVLKLRQAWLHQKSPSDDDSVVLPYVAGRTNVTTLQLNLNF